MSGFMERVAPVVNETIRALAKTKFINDPIAGEGYSRATSMSVQPTSDTPCQRRRQNVPNGGGILYQSG
jgi:hypothetical protein